MVMVYQIYWSIKLIFHKKEGIDQIQKYKAIITKLKINIWYSPINNENY